MQLMVENLNKKAYDAIKLDILERRLPAGTRLVDSKLAEQYGISRTPIRDALMKLAEEGLVAKATKGYSVFMPSADDIRELFELRLMIDLYTAKTIIEDILPKKPDAQNIIDEVYSRNPSEDTFVKGDEEFHDTLVAITGNTRLINFYSSIRNQMRAFRSVTARNYERMNQANNYHGKIYQAIRSRDLVAAEVAIRVHTQLSMEDALRDFI